MHLLVVFQYSQSISFTISSSQNWAEQMLSEIKFKKYLTAVQLYTVFKTTLVTTKTLRSLVTLISLTGQN